MGSSLQKPCSLLPAKTAEWDPPFKCRDYSTIAPSTITNVPIAPLLFSLGSGGQRWLSGVFWTSLTEAKAQKDTLEAPICYSLSSAGSVCFGLFVCIHRMTGGSSNVVAIVFLWGPHCFSLCVPFSTPENVSIASLRFFQSTHAHGLAAWRPRRQLLSFALLSGLNGKSHFANFRSVASIERLCPFGYDNIHIGQSSGVRKPLCCLRYIYAIVSTLVRTMHSLQADLRYSLKFHYYVFNR